MHGATTLAVLESDNKSSDYASDMELREFINPIYVEKESRGTYMHMYNYLNANLEVHYASYVLDEQKSRYYKYTTTKVWLSNPMQASYKSMALFDYTEECSL